MASRFYTGFPLARGAGIKCMESCSVPVTPGGYFLYAYVRIATMSNATDVINCNSSYVLIRHPLPSRLRVGTVAALLAAWVRIFILPG